MSEEKTTPAPEEAQLTIAEFLESCPPGSDRLVIGGTRADDKQSRDFLRVPELHLHCTNERCNGLRFWSSRDMYEVVSTKELTKHFVSYTCRNCQRNTRLFALLAIAKSSENSTLRLIKLGEAPAFGPPTPARLISMIGPDRDAFLSGRRCENQSLGIGAFAYYRRVVENQRTRIIDEMIRVAERVGAADDVITDLKAARSETQFSKSVDAIRHGIPDSIMVKGRNPLSLLHSALSEGLHSQDDAVCLDLARSIRVVLAELAERLSQALKDDNELTAAVDRLARSK